MAYFGFKGKEIFQISAGENRETLRKKFANIDPNFEPAYLKLHQTGELKRRAEELWQIMQDCRLCPRKCSVNRLKGQIGFCRAPGMRLYISSYHPHFGEERPLVGRGGSGTIFLTHCNLRCIFCQNWTISHLGRGAETDVERLAEIMLKLQEMGCHNINDIWMVDFSLKGAPINMM